MHAADRRKRHIFCKKPQKLRPFRRQLMRALANIIIEIRRGNNFVVLDKNFREVGTGSLVKVLFIEPGFISTFPYKEAKIMKSMLNKTFEVVGIEQGKALVHQPFDAFNSFTLALAPEEMELVDETK